MRANALAAATAATLTLLSLGGCASSTYKPSPYEPEHSRAYNIVHAGGINNGIKDAKVPKDTVGLLENSWGYGAASTALAGLKGVSGPGIFSGGLGAGIGFAQWLLQPDSPAERITLIAWMPEDMAPDRKQARSALTKLVADIMPKVLEDLGMETPKNGALYVTENQHQALIAFHGNQGDCPAVYSTKRACFIHLYSYTPKVGGRPAFLNSADPRAYAFTAEHKVYYTYLEVHSPKDSGVDQMAIYRALSARLPEWVYLYLPPKKVLMPDGTTLPYPVVLEQGKPLFFVVPES